MSSKTTDSEGKCRFTNILNGTYGLSVSKTDYNSYNENISINNTDISKEISLEKTPLCIFEVDATLGSTFQFSLSGAGMMSTNGNSVIDWGDGTSETFNIFYRGSHSYSDSTKKYTVTVTNAYVGDYCFYGCGNLVNLTLPYIRSAMTNMFVANCGNLEFIKFLTDTISLGWRSFNDVPSSCVMYVPTGCKEAYETVFIEAGYSFTVEEY